MGLEASSSSSQSLRVVDPAWAPLVAAQVSPTWRVDEWRPDVLLFTGLLDSGNIRAFLCTTPECGLSSITSGRPCRDCLNQLRSYIGDRAEFRRRVVVQKAWVGDVLPTCEVRNHTGKCERTQHVHRMCISHWTKWTRAQKRGEPLETYMSQNPSVYMRRPDCRILGCSHESAVDRWTLCGTHRGQCQAGASARGLSMDNFIDSFLSSARPLVRRHQFSLAGMREVLKNEFLYVLQERDAVARLDPDIVRTIQDLMTRYGYESFLEITDEEIASFPRTSNQQRAFLRFAQMVLKRLKYTALGFDGRNADIWDSSDLGLFTTTARTHRSLRGTLDFTPIRVQWVKEVAKEWVLQDKPDTRTARKAIRAASVATLQLRARPGGLDSSRLGVEDMTAVVDGLNQLKRSDGKPYSLNTKLEHLVGWRKMLEFGRSTEFMRSVPSDFSLGIKHRITKEESEEEVIGKSLPDFVIRILDSRLDDFRPILKRSIQGWTDDDISYLYQTCYLILRNTGRRLSEVLKLKRDCLRYKGRDAYLVYTNFKRRRNDRWLPIEAETAAIIAKWQSHVSGLPSQKFTEKWLFPSPGMRVTLAGHYGSGAFVDAFNRWKGVILEPVTAGGGPKQLQVIDPTRVTSRAFRHTYAQRHADAGTPVDVLRELMDHKSIETTMGYYQVSLKRKSEAVGLMAPLVVDRMGNRYPESDAASYELRSVAVPFGNCTEPANVKAGGEACPVRFQCAGCDFYRPDPSFTPAVEEHIAKLRNEREAALTIGAADWVVRNYDDQIAAFKNVATLMDRLMEELTDEQRQAVDEASAVLRKTRAGRTFIPLETISIRPPDV